MQNFFNRDRDGYDSFKGGAFSEELKDSMRSGEQGFPVKNFLLHLGRFLAIFIVVFLIILAGVWLWRENSSTTVNSPAVESVEESNTAGPAPSDAPAVAAVDGRSAAAPVSETDIIDTSASLAGITLWSAVSASAVFIFAVAGHRLIHNLLEA